MASRRSLASDKGNCRAGQSRGGMGGGQAHVVGEGLETEAAIGTRAGPAGREARAGLTLWAPGLGRTAWAPGLERALERTTWAPGLERALERTAWAPGLERALEWTAWDAAGAVWADAAASGAV